MKILPGLLTVMLTQRSNRRNLRLLARFIAALIALMLAHSLIFHAIMHMEGQDRSMVDGIYWTLTTMSTLGYGDITFQSSLGKVFSMVVIFSGLTFLLVLFPFTFIEFFYAPWMKAQAAARAPRVLPDTLSGHVLITHLDSVTESLIRKFDQYHQPYALIVPELEEALRLHDEGFHILLGELDSPQTYRNARIDHAALVVTTASDPVNTNVGFTVRELSPEVPVVATASRLASVDVLELAGATRVLQLGEMMGSSLARRTIGGDALAHIIGEFEGLFIAEATAAGTPFVGKTLAESRLRELAGVNVVGVWERGRFEAAGPTTVIGPHTVLILSGSREQLTRYDELLCIYHQNEGSVVIIGGGRVGRATGRALQQRDIDYKIVERDPARVRDAERTVVGDASDLDTLHRAGLRHAPAVIITTHDDDINIYLTIYCRRLRPDIQIISRSVQDRNVSTLHRAGADFVMSYASMGSNAVLNLLKQTDVLMVAEGLSVFRVKVPVLLQNKTLGESNVREATGCSIVAVRRAGELTINPPPSVTLDADSILFVIGSVEDEKLFLNKYHASIIN